MFNAKQFLLSVVAAIVVFGTASVTGQDKQINSEDLVPSSAMGALFLKPKDALEQPGMELLPREIITAFGQKELGFDPCKITRLIALVDSIQDFDSPPQFGLFVEFDSPQKVSEDLINRMKMTKDQLDGKTLYRGEFGETLYLLNDRSFVFGFEAFINKMLNTKGANSPLLKEIKQTPPDGHLDVYLAVEPVRALIKSQLPPADQVPPPLREFLELPDLINSITLNESFSKDGKNQLQIHAISKEAATKIDTMLKQGLGVVRQMVLGNMMSEMRDQDPVLRDAMVAYVNRIADYLQAEFLPRIDGERLVMDFGADQTEQLANIGTIGMLVGMLLPAVQSVREAARRTSAANQLRQCALAALNYEYTSGKFPAQAIYSEDGKPLLSWRVQLLPYMEQNDLYKQFKLDEPWDSAHNIKLLDRMPEIYRGPNSVHTNKTVFQGWSGPGTMFDGNKQATLRGIVDGSSNTMFFVETNDEAAVEWTKPADYRWRDDNPIWGLRNNRPGGFNSVFVDGSVQFITFDIDLETLKNMALKADGNPIRR